MINYEKILRRSWVLTFKNKWLWVYGLVIAALTGGSGFNGFGGGSSSSSSSGSKTNLPTKEGEKVLGQAVSALTSWFARVPMTTWILLVLGIALLILLGVIVTWVARVWAKGALIGGLKDADDEKEITLINTAPHGFKNIKNLMIYGLISGGISMGIFIVLILVIGLGALLFSFAQPLMILWLILTVTVGILVTIISVILLAMVNIYAERLIVLEKITPWEAWKSGLSFSKGNFLNTMLMGLINSMLGCATGCLTMVLLAVLAVPAIIFALLLPVGIIGIILLLILFLSASLVIRMVLIVFTYGNWNLFFKEVTGGK